MPISRMFNESGSSQPQVDGTVLLSITNMLADTIGKSKTKKSMLIGIASLVGTMGQTGGTNGIRFRMDDLQKGAKRTLTEVDSHGRMTDTEVSITGLVEDGQVKDNNVKAMFQTGLAMKMHDSVHKATTKDKNVGIVFTPDGINEAMKAFIIEYTGAATASRDKAVPASLHRAMGPITRAFLVLLACGWEPSGGANKRFRGAKKSEGKELVKFDQSEAEERRRETMKARNDHDIGNASQILSVLSSDIDEGGLVAYVARVACGLIKKNMNNDIETILHLEKAAGRDREERIEVAGKMITEETCVKYARGIMDKLSASAKAKVVALRQYLSAGAENEDISDFFEELEDDRDANEAKALIIHELRGLIPELDSNTDMTPSNAITSIDKRVLVHAILAYLSTASADRPIFDPILYHPTVNQVITMAQNGMSTLQQDLDTRRYLYATLIDSLKYRFDEEEEWYAKILHQLAVPWVPAVDYATWMKSYGISEATIMKVKPMGPVAMYAGAKELDPSTIANLGNNELPIFQIPVTNEKKSGSNMINPKNGRKRKAEQMLAFVPGRVYTRGSSGNNRHLNDENLKLAESVIKDFEKNTKFRFNFVPPETRCVARSFVALAYTETEAGRIDVTPYDDFINELMISKHWPEQGERAFHHGGRKYDEAIPVLEASQVRFDHLDTEEMISEAAQNNIELDYTCF